MGVGDEIREGADFGVVGYRFGYGIVVAVGRLDVGLVVTLLDWSFQQVTVAFDWDRVGE